jgi:hypothetical protein
MIFDSLVKQDGGVNEEIFDTAWRVIKAYVSGEEEKISGGTGFGLKRLESDTEGLAPDFLEIAPMEHEGDKEWAWRPVFKNSSQKETWNYTGIYVLDKYGNENYNGKDKLLAFLQSKFGKHKNIVIPDAYKPE